MEQCVGAPLFPFLVVINTTPPAAREPYMEAEASFNTDIASISCGLIIFISPGFRSTKTSGYSLRSWRRRHARSSRIPRYPVVRMFAERPIPGISPCKADRTFVTGLESITSEDIFEIAPERLLRFCVPSTDHDYLIKPSGCLPLAGY